jgi:CRISPR-associated exonuclease Cas4
MLEEKNTVETDLALYDCPFRVTDLKQWIYCQRILYYYLCLPEVRPVTYKMQAGIEAGEEEADREMRRSLRVYGLKNGRREYDLALKSSRLGLRGIVDMVIFKNEDKGEEIMPVDYKLSEHPSPHYHMQLIAYGLLLEENYGNMPKRGFLYSIPRRKAEEVSFTKVLRQRCLDALSAMQQMLYKEIIPEPTHQHGKCLACEFRRFCNDVI